MEAAPATLLPPVRTRSPLGLRGADNPTFVASSTDGCLGGESSPSADNAVMIVAGGSPTSSITSTGSSSMDLKRSATHPPRRQRQRPRLLRWVVHSVARRDTTTACQEQQPLPTMETYQPSLVSGSSYDSLDELGLTGNPTQPSAAGWQEQQQELPALPALGAEPVTRDCGHHQAGEAAAAAAAAAAQASSSSSSSNKGRVQRCVGVLLRPLVRAVCSVARAVAAHAGPSGPGNNDSTTAERIANVLTSLPFFLVGLHGLRHRSGPGRRFSQSFLLVGAAASAYHGADRSSWARLLCRRLDYASICISSVAMRRAAHIHLPRPLIAVASVLAPVKPSLVTGLNLALVELRFVRAALAAPQLMGWLTAHLGSAVLGLTAFALEDVAICAGWPPVLHSAWHVASAGSMACLHALFGHLEAAQPAC